LVFGYEDQHGHAEVSFTDVRVPVSNLLGAEGEGFALAQARLGPGRIHHCMRAIGMTERALSLMIKRVIGREAFGKELVQQGVIQGWIAQARIDIEQARLLVLKAAWMIDTVGAKGARKEIAAIKVAVPQMAERIIDHAIQSYGGAGISQVTPLASMYAGVRALRIVDGPDEVHIRDIARLEIKSYL
jgi:acyl-CoA dehydrogenase